MHHHAAHIALAAALLAPAVSARGPLQEDGQPDSPLAPAAAPEHPYVTVEDIEGAEVRLRAPADAQDGEAPKAEVQDALILNPTGKLMWAVLRCEGREVLVPFSDVRWDAGAECFTSDLSRIELEALPEFDLAQARRDGLDQAIALVERGRRAADRGTSREEELVEAKKQIREAAAKGARVGEGGYLVLSEPYYCTSALDELELRAGSEEFGGVIKSIVDLDTQRVEFFVVSRGGLAGVGSDEYLIPYGSVRICVSGEDEGAEPALCTDASMEKLESAVRYEKPKKGVLDPAQAKEALERASKDA